MQVLQINPRCVEVNQIPTHAQRLSWHPQWQDIHCYGQGWNMRNCSYLDEQQHKSSTTRTSRILVASPEWKKPLWIRRSWEGNIKTNLIATWHKNHDCIQPHLGRANVWISVNTAMNLRVQERVTIFQPAEWLWVWGLSSVASVQQ